MAGITDRKPRETYAVGATPQSTFAVPFPFFDTRDLRVYVGGALRTIGTHYTVAGGNGTTGSVTLTAAVTNTKVSIVRRIPIDRLTDFPSGAGFRVPMLNREQDRNIAIDQQIADDNARALRPPDDEDFEGALPSAAERSGRLLAFDVDGQPIATAATLEEIDAVIAGQVVAGGTLASFGPLTADGTTTTFDTGFPLSSAVRVEVLVGGAQQQAGYTVSGSSVIFAAAPPAGLSVAGRVFGVTPSLGDSAPPVSHATPQPLGAASGGVSPEPAAVDHVHAMPSAAQVGAAPTSHGHAIVDVTGLPAALDGKAGDAATTAALALKAPLASPTFSGAPTVPTPANGTNTGQVASTAFVQAAIALLVNSSPSTLDTLKELADALGNDPNFATTITNLIATKAPLASPALTGTPTAPTAATPTSTTQIATTAFVQAVVAALRPLESIIIACGDEATAITAGTAKVSFRMPYAFTVTAVRASLVTAQASGSIFTVDVNEGGTSILSTKLTIDNTELSTTTAATPPVISDSALADDALITIDVDQIGTSGAKGLKVTLIGRQSA